MNLSVIIPVYNGIEYLQRCLEALSGSTYQPHEVIIVDDASTDGTVELARRLGARVIQLSKSPRGPAFARNRGAEEATGEILFFTDVDVALHPDTLDLASRTLEADQTLAACFGSYDDKPAASGFVAQYKNLLHYYVHQSSRQEASTFWAGCGAVRRTVFEAVGGFDETYTHPSIEDIELGGRLLEAGYKIKLVKAMQATHLKGWQFAEVIRSDFRDRAIPWTRLILRQRKIPDDLNLRISARVSTAVVYLLILTLVSGFVWSSLWYLSLLLIFILLILNADEYIFFVRHRGWWFACRAILLHWLYYAYSGMAFTVGVVSYLLQRKE